MDRLKMTTSTIEDFLHAFSPYSNQLPNSFCFFPKSQLLLAFDDHLASALTLGIPGAAPEGGPRLVRPRSAQVHPGPAGGAVRCWLDPNVPFHPSLYTPWQRQ